MTTSTKKPILHQSPNTAGPCTPIDRQHAVTAMLATLTDNHLTWWLINGLAEFMPGLPLFCV